MGQKSVLIVVVLVILAVVFLVIFLLRSLQPDKSPETVKNTPEIEALEKRTVAANDIINDPLVYDGLYVEVEAPITDWVTKRSFTLGATRGVFGGRGVELLAVRDRNFRLPKDTTGAELGLGETVTVRIKARVRIADRVELSKIMGIDLDGTDIALDDSNIENWNEGSVLLITSVEKL